MNTTETPRRRGRPSGSIQALSRSDRVAKVRNACGMTQELFARELGCSISTVRKLEQNSLLPTSKAVMDELIRLAESKGISLEDGN